MRLGILGFVFASLLAISGIASAGNIVFNDGFESGALSPWYEARDLSSNGGYRWMVGVSNAYGGSYSASVGDNYELRQDFSAVSASSISQIKFTALINNFMSYDFFYSDGSEEEYFVFGTSAWDTYDVTSNLNLSKDLVGISFWGNTAGQSFIDDIVIAAQIARVPEPSSLFLAVIGLFGLVFLRCIRVN